MHNVHLNNTAAPLYKKNQTESHFPHQTLYDFQEKTTAKHMIRQDCKRKQISIYKGGRTNKKNKTTNFYLALWGL